MRPAPKARRHAVCPTPMATCWRLRADVGGRAPATRRPSVWLFDARLKPLMQMPAGTGTFQTVPEQLEILRLEQ